MTKIITRDKENLCMIFEMEGKPFINIVSGGAHPYTITLLLKVDEANVLATDTAKRRQLVYDVIKSPDQFKSRRIEPALDP